MHSSSPCPPLGVAVRVALDAFLLPLPPPPLGVAVRVVFDAFLLPLPPPPPPRPPLGVAVRAGVKLSRCLCYQCHMIPLPEAMILTEEAYLSIP